MNFGKNLKEIRTKAKMSQTTFAVKLGISKGYLSQIESGQREPRASKMEDIAKILKKPLSDLMK